MVFCGKPSRSCGPCRLKRRKCDRVRPACGQCSRAGSNCEGYRSEEHLSFQFRDQTNSVVSKFGTKRNQKPRPALTTDTSVTFSPERVSLQSSKPSSTVPIGLFVPIGDYGVGAFYSHFVCSGMELETKYGIIELVSTSFKGSSDVTMLSEITAAIGLLSVAKSRHGEVISASRRKYVSALKSTNQALSKPTEALKDETLITVVLLAMYEATTCSQVDALKSWIFHIEGATMLLSMRGVGQFERKIGLGLFEYLRPRVILSCFQQGKRVPPEILALSEQARQFQTPDGVKATDLSVIVSRFCAFRAWVKDCDPSDHDRIQVMAEIDAAMAEWASTLTEGYAITKIPAKPGGFVYGNYYEIYTHKWICSVWNNLRVMRRILNRFIRGHLLRTRLVPMDDPQIKKIEEIISESTLGIFASVPFLFNSSGPYNKAEDVPDLHNMAVITWFLYTIADDQYGDPSMRKWALETLREMGKNGFASQAKFMGMAEGGTVILE